MGEIKDERAIPYLVKAFDTTEDCRLQAIEALGKIGGEKTLEQLKKYLSYDDPMILYAAIEAIGNVGHKDSVKALKEFLNYDDITIAEASMTAIIKISLNNDGQIEQDLPLDKFSKFLFNGVKNKDKMITKFTLDRLNHWYGSNVLKSLLNVLSYVEEDDLNSIVEMLGQIGPSAADMILEEFDESPSSHKVIFLNILKQYADEEIARKLTKYVNDNDPEVRQNIAYILGISGTSDVIPTLRELTKDMIGHVRSAAYGALGWLCSEEEIDILFEGLNDNYVDVRESVMGALVILGSERVVKRFSEDLYHKDVERQRLAATALGLIGDISVVDTLLQAINHPEASIRRSAIDSLGKIREVDNINPLVLALNDENISVRKAAATSLVNIKGIKAMPEIRFLLDDEDIWVRYHAINLISEFGKEFAQYIEPYLDSEEDIIKIATIKGLSKMGCKTAISQIEKLHNEKNQDVVDAVQMAVADLQGK